MAKRPTKTDDNEVTVIVTGGFKHRGQYVRAGETIRMEINEAADMATLHMIRFPRPNEAAP